MIDESLLKEWNYEKNEKSPDYYSPQSSQKVWWKCSKGHEWQVSISNRVAGNGCPYCANQKVLAGYNDLATTNPELLEEWDSERNGELTPQMVVAGSEKKAWWKCNKGHEWEARIANRSRGASCPFCAGRRVWPGFNDLASQYPDIAKEWNCERNKSLTPQLVSAGSHKKVWWKCSKGHEWEAQVYHRINDGGCPVCSNHKVLKGYNDLSTTNPSLAAEWNYEKNGSFLPDDFTQSSNKKVWWKCSKGHEWEATINSRNAGNGCPYCSNQKVLAGYNDLATTHPELAAEWDFEKNKRITPQMVAAGSGKKYWWRCTEGHSWHAMVSHRKMGVGCPICAGQVVLSGFNDLATINPKLASEWNYDRNGSLTPHNITCGSEKKVWWKCSKGHEWKAGVGQRSSTGNGCPICSNKHVLEGFNDLATTHPEIASEWNYEKNDELTPQMVTAGSNKKVWWKCKNGHEWKAQVNARLQGAGCAQCSSHLKTSFPEQAIYYYVKQTYPDAQNGYKDIFNSRRTIMELDIYIPSIKTAIEYDGLVWHSSKKAQDREEEKYEICKTNHITLIRVKENIDPESKACDVLLQSNYASNYRNFNSTLYDLGRYIKLPQDMNIIRDRNTILNQYIPKLHNKAITITNPELMDEWNHEKNIDISPDKLTATSRNKVWWKCKYGHEWRTSVDERVSGSACPICRKRVVLAGFNDLATNDPLLAREWNHERNGSLTPEMVTVGSGKKVWWLCQKGHEWQAQIAARHTKKQGCPYCSGHRVLAGFNDLLTTNPELGKEWNYDKNGSLSPKTITAGSNKKVWWKCEKGHEWQAQVNARNRGNKCPYCSIKSKSKQ